MIRKIVSTYGELKTSYDYLAKTNPFFIYFSIWLFLLLIPLLLTSKYESFVLINHTRSFSMDIIFTFFTILGNGIILIPLAIFFIIRKNYQLLIGLLLSVVLNTLVVSILKHTFSESRPLACYGEGVVHTARWIKLYTRYSFPSGHTASAFCMAAYLSLSYSKKRNVAIVTFICAALTGYSRIYLGEHFLQDVWFGSFIGVIMAILTAISFQQFTNKILHWKKNK